MTPNLHRTARYAGAIYFVFALWGVFQEFLFPRFLVRGDPAATAQNILNSELTYRAGIASSLLGQILFVYLAVILFKLFREVNRTQAVLMLSFVCVAAALALSNLIFKLVPLALLGDQPHLAVFSKSQLEALAQSSFSIHSSGNYLTEIFWGFWLFPFGYLVVKSGFLPRWLGYALFLAGFAYVVSSVLSILYPSSAKTVFQVLTPLYMGELPIIFWLLIKGANYGTGRQPHSPTAS